MNLGGPIILVDDGKDDLEIFGSALAEIKIKNNVITFNTAEKFLEYFKTTDDEPFFILCDVNMPIINGFELRKKIYADKGMESISIPFIYFSTSSDSEYISKAYKLPIQGYFQKPIKYDDIKKMFILIISYWTSSFHPVTLDVV